MPRNPRMVRWSELTQPGIRCASQMRVFFSSGASKLSCCRDADLKEDVDMGFSTTGERGLKPATTFENRAEWPPNVVACLARVSAAKTPFYQRLERLLARPVK